MAYSVICWLLRRLCVDKWVVKVVQAVFKDAESKVRINNDFNNEINIDSEWHPAYTWLQNVYFNICGHDYLHIVGHQAPQMNGTVLIDYTKLTGWNIKPGKSTNLQFNTWRCICLLSNKMMGLNPLSSGFVQILMCKV